MLPRWRVSDADSCQDCIVSIVDEWNVSMKHWWSDTDRRNWYTVILWGKCVPLPLCLIFFFACVLYLYPIYTFISSPFKFLLHAFYLSLISSFLTSFYFHIPYIVTIEGNFAQNILLQNNSLLCATLLLWFSSGNFSLWAHTHVHIFNLDHYRFVWLI
jgi:hypothetical protein